MPRRLHVRARVLIVAVRIVLATITSTATAGLVAFAMMWFLLRNWEHNDPIDAARSVGAGVTFLGMLISQVAVGMMFLVVVWRPLTLRVVIGLGAILGNLPFAALVAIVVLVQLARGHISTDIGRGWYGWPGAERDIVMGTVTGVISAAVFWVIGIWRTGLEHGPLSTLLKG
jgi:hypothetical protein